MSLLVKTILILLISSTAHAENIICYNAITMYITKNVQGDCLALSICTDFNNGGIPANCFIATQEERDKAQQEFVKVDKTVVTGSRIVDLTQAEIDAILAARQQAQIQVEAQRLADIDASLANIGTTGTKLQRVEQAIDNIGNLNDAKIFLKKLVRYLSDFSLSD